MRVLGIDSSSKRCGVALADGGSVEWSRCWNSDPRKPSAENLYGWFMWLHLLVGEAQPDVGVVELNGWTQNRLAAHALARYEAAAVLALKCRGVPAIEARVSEARRITLGNGGLGKPAAAAAVRALVAVDLPTDDEADAAVLALAGESLAER